MTRGSKHVSRGVGRHGIALGELLGEALERTRKPLPKIADLLERPRKTCSRSTPPRLTSYLLPQPLARS